MTVLALGFFDGVHIGHGALLERTLQRAKELNCEPAVMTFDTHPDTLVFGHNVPLINSAPDRARLIRKYYGIDRIEFLRFTTETMHLSWREFLELITKEMDVRHFVVGYDFSFGYKGEGNADKLQQWCDEQNLSCDIINKVEIDGITVSSTYIRTLLADGNVRKAAQFMKHNHILTDEVRSGHRLGRQLGAPTINMQFGTNVLVPKHGVYATRVLLDEGEYVGVTNIGNRPTVDTGENITVETHILNYSGNLYGRSITLEFLDYIRPEQKFETVSELSEQIKQDALQAQHIAEEF